jgi:hypothetical protein
MALGSSVGFWLGGGMGGAAGSVGGPVAAGTSVAGAIGVGVGGLIDAGIHFFSQGSSGGDDGGLGRWARGNGLNANSSTTQNLFDNRSTSVDDFISQFRKGGIRDVFPSEHLGKTVEEALREGGSIVRKLLIDQRWAK